MAKAATGESGVRLELEERALDAVSTVLAMLRLRGEVFCRSELSGPWGLSFASNEVYFHVIERGTCLVQAGPAETPIALHAGDLIVLPHGRGHRMFDAPGRQVVPILRLLQPTRKPPTGVLRFGGGGEETHLLCGRFRFDPELKLSILAGFPSVLHVPGTGGRAPEWLDWTMRLLVAEARTNAPGRDMAMARLVDLLFVQALRYWISLDDAHPLGWLRALRDPRIAVAVAAIHARPQRPWDIPTLAAEVGMSRSSFAQRFVEIVGEPPSKYLARWRVHVAAQLLQVPGTTIAGTAARVGYASEAAFSRAFKRYMHVAPASFRLDRERDPVRGRFRASSKRFGDPEG